MNLGPGALQLYEKFFTVGTSPGTIFFLELELYRLAYLYSSAFNK